MLQTIMKRQALVYFSMVRRSAAFFSHNKNCVQSDCHSHVCCQSACISGRAYIYICRRTQDTQTRTCPSRDILSTSFKTMTLKRPPAAV